MTSETDRDSPRSKAKSRAKQSRATKLLNKEHIGRKRNSSVGKAKFTMSIKQFSKWFTQQILCKPVLSASLVESSLGGDLSKSSHTKVCVFQMLHRSRNSKANAIKGLMHFVQSHGPVAVFPASKCCWPEACLLIMLFFATCKKGSTIEWETRA